MHARVMIAGALVASVLSAAGWTGRLADARCKEANPRAACPVTASTKQFGVVKHRFLSRKYYRLEEAGNERVAAALEERRKRTGLFPRGARDVWFRGEPKGDTLALEEFVLR
jgi:hypothetical protein